MSWYFYKPYVSVGERRRLAARAMDKLRKKGVDIQPVAIAGRTIAHSFWGRAWCEHLEKFSDYENRLPRGRAYVRNGSVCHLEVGAGSIEARVQGSELYKVRISVAKLPGKKWQDVKGRCAGRIGSLLELLQGRLSEQVMEVVTDRDRGLFPLPKEIDLDCSCPDWADMCKHVAAVLYGVGARLDTKPELLFLLRGVNHEELITAGAGAVASVAEGKRRGRRRLADGELAEVFGIEMAEAHPVRAAKRATRPAARRPAPLTGGGVARLRAEFGMTLAQFAKLLGVSAPTIGNWERKAGAVNAQPRKSRLWAEVSVLSKGEAWERLRKGGGR